MEMEDLDITQTANDVRLKTIFSYFVIDSCRDIESKPWWDIYTNIISTIDAFALPTFLQLRMPTWYIIFESVVVEHRDVPIIL